MAAPKRHRVVLLLATVALAGPAAADEPPGVLTRPPAVVVPVQPLYPPEASALGVTAEVVLELELSAAGEVTAARVVRPAGHGFDEAALAAAAKLRFTPAEVDGKPAAVRIEYRYRFEQKPAAPAAVSSPNLRGRLLERGTRASVANATVEIVGAELGTSSDDEGRFELAGVPAGPVRIVVTDGSHQRFETDEAIEEGQVTEVKYYLRRKLGGAFEAVIAGDKDRKEVTRVAVSAGEIAMLPGVSGDAVRVVQNLPGVARAAAGFGPLIVRGGNSLDTRVYVDGVEVPLVFHFGGLTSIYSSELASEVEFEPGNFGVSYGRATAGRINLKTRDPNGKRVHLVGDVNLYHGTAFAEGPLAPGLAGAVAVRRSYVDAILNAASGSLGDDVPGFATAPRYYDYQGKLTFTASPSDTLRLDVFGSDDGVELVGVKTEDLMALDQLDLHTGFHVISGRWDHRFAPGSSLRVAVAQQFVSQDEVVGTHVSQKIREALTSVRAEWSQELLSGLDLSIGLDGRWSPSLRVQATAPQFERPGVVLDHLHGLATRADLDFVFSELGAWAELSFRPFGSAFTIVPGVRWDRTAPYPRASFFDPRLNVRWTLGAGTTLKGGIGLYHQPPEMAYCTAEWGNPDLREEGARQYGIGIEQHIFGPLSADLELYYKDLYGLAVPSTRTVVRDGAGVPERYASTGTGKAYGAELLLRYRPDGRFFGWLSYSLSRTERQEESGQAETSASGELYDQPHNLTLVGAIKLPELWDGFSAALRVRYTSGNPFRAVAGAVYDVEADQFTGLTTSTWGRAPAFFQVDVRFDKVWTYRTWQLSLYLDVQNVTNRESPESVAYNHDYTRQGFTTGLPIFPSFGLRAEY